MNLRHYFDFSREKDPAYFNSIFEQRSKGHPNQAGSFYNETPAKICTMLENADWTEDTTVQMKTGLKCFKTKVSGFQAMINVDRLYPNLKIAIIKPKQTDEWVCFGLLNSTTPPKEVKSTRMIVAINPDSTGFILTVYPGRDIKPEKVYANEKGIPETGFLKVGKYVTPAQLKLLGIRYVKLM